MRRPVQRCAFRLGQAHGKRPDTVVAHYRGDTPRKADFFHGKGDGTTPEDLTRCYHCGYETYRLMSHCPECGRSMQSKRWSRRYGWILLVLGLAISAVIAMVLLAIGPALLERSGGLRFSGSAGEAKLALGILGAVELFGITATSLWALANRDRATEQMGDLLHARLLRICVAGGAVPYLKEKLQNACADCRYMTRRVAFVSPKNEITKFFSLRR